jgi:uncharacterized OB-fold protein
MEINMDFKKCARCGSFFASVNNVCCNCEPRDKADIYKLANYINENTEISSMAVLSAKTDITTNNLNRFIQNDEIPNVMSEISGSFFKN